MSRQIWEIWDRCRCGSDGPVIQLSAGRCQCEACGKVQPAEQPCQVAGPYSAGFVAALKAAVPAPDREWSPERLTWTINGRHRAPVVALVAEHNRGPR